MNKVKVTQQDIDEAKAEVDKLMKTNEKWETVTRIGNILDAPELGAFPVEPLEGIRINVIERGFHKGRGFNACYCRPGQTVKTGQTKHFLAPKDCLTEIGGLKAAYDKALDRMSKEREMDLEIMGPVTDTERQIEKKLRKTRSRANREARYLQSIVERLRNMSKENLARHWREAGLGEGEADEADMLCDLIRAALDVVYGKDKEEGEET